MSIEVQIAPHVTGGQLGVHSATPIMTGCWFSKLDPQTYCVIGISRGVPRGLSGYKRYRKLNPGPWFKSVTAELYRTLYFDEILAPLDPETVVGDIHMMSDGRLAVLACWEPSTPTSSWCHRGLVSAWLHDRVGLEVYELGQESEGFGWAHPKLHPSFRK